MQVISVISTNGDVGKTALTANPGSFVADAGLRVLLLNLDMQPTLPSYHEMLSHAPGSIDELSACNRQDLGKIVPRITINRLDLLLSNDEYRHLYTLLLHAPDGRLRLHNLLLLHVFQQKYDLAVLDAQGVRTVSLERVLLAWQQAIPPVMPKIFTARELHQAPLQLLVDIAPSPLHLLINRVPAVSSNAHMIPKTLRLILQEQADIHILDTEIPVMKPFLMQQLSACKRIALIRTRRALHEKLCATCQQSCCSSGMSSSCKSQEKPAEGMPMSTARELARGHKLLLPLIEYALKEGWEVERTSGGHLKFTKPGMPPIFTGSTASDYCAGRNTRALLRRTRHQFATDESSPKK
ncbi:AAA family ATPase [Dickeya zeae]